MNTFKIHFSCPFDLSFALKDYPRTQYKNGNDFFTIDLAENEYSEFLQTCERNMVEVFTIERI